jgi:hypothetical protein
VDRASVSEVRGAAAHESSLKHPGVAESPEGKTVRGLIKRERAEFPKPREADGQRHS